MVVVSLELEVVDRTLPEYKRAYAWVSLVRVWAALRFDDSAHVQPGEIVWSEELGLDLLIRRTKTTGAGKRIAVLTAHVGPEAYLAVPEWLGVGFAVFRALGGLPRDYLLPMPTHDLAGFRRAPVRYADEITLLRAQLGELRKPLVDVDGVWRAGQEQMIPPELTAFWTAHSHRAVLASWGACLGLSKEVLDRLGRWASTGSSDYIRTNRALVTGAQAQIAAAVRAGTEAAPGAVEGDLLASIGQRLAEDGYDDAHRHHYVEGLRYMGVYAYTAAGAPAPAPEAAPAVAELEDLAPTDGAGDVGAAVNAEVFDGDSYDHIVAITRHSGARCLHMADGCYQARHLRFARFQTHRGLPAPSEYHRVCRTCWRCSVIRAGGALSAGGAASGAEASSSSSSSSSSEPEPAL